MLNLGADWLRFLLPHAMRKVSRVHYGLLSPAEIAQMELSGSVPRSRRFLAVPFVGKDAPSHSSEFAHPDVAIGLTILAYRYEGLREPTLARRSRTCARDRRGGRPRARGPSSLTWIAWVQAAGRRVRGARAAEDEHAAARRPPPVRPARAPPPPAAAAAAAASLGARRLACSPLRRAGARAEVGGRRRRRGGGSAARAAAAASRA